MKRYLEWILLFFLSLILSGCQGFSFPTFNTIATTTTTEVQYSETPFTLSTYATGVSFKAYTYDPDYRLPEVYIDVTFTEVAYNPFDEEICVTFDVDDPSRVHASYFAILQDRETMSTRVLQQFFGNGFSHFSAGACFDLADSTLDYRIIIGKFDTDNPNKHYDYVEGSAWMEWTDRHIAERHTIAGIVRHDRTPATVDSLTESLISYSLVVDDPDAVIDSLTVQIRDAFDNLVDSAVIDSGSIRSGTHLNVNDAFDGLAPNAAYVVYVYASGNDGVDDFTDIFLTKIELCSARFSLQGDYDETLSYDGLYAVI
ncbi:MAG: hypothetical protein Q8N15_00970, partial [Bacillota bacterium]|nr:hypothetical protein [Bacillota bacterium]